MLMGLGDRALHRRDGTVGPLVEFRPGHQIRLRSLSPFYLHCRRAHWQLQVVITSRCALSADKVLRKLKALIILRRHRRQRPDRPPSSVAWSRVEGVRKPVDLWKAFSHIASAGGGGSPSRVGRETA